MNIVIPIHHVLHSKHGLVSKTVVVHHKGISWVKRVNLKRGVIFLSTFIRKNHAEGRSANVEPVSQLLILCGLFLRKHKFVKLIDGLCNVLRIATGHILQRFTHQIPGLERHNLVRPVLHNLIANLWPYLLFSIENWLSALVVVPQIFNFRPVLPVNGKCLAQDTYHVVNGYFGFIGLDDTSAMQRHSHAEHPLQSIILPTVIIPLSNAYVKYYLNRSFGEFLFFYQHGRLKISTFAPTSPRNSFSSKERESGASSCGTFPDLV